MYRDIYGLNVTALRLGWVYGRGISDYRLNSGISLFLRKALVGERVNIPYGGDTFCDFVHAIDTADAIYKTAQVGRPESFAYNIVYEKGYYMKEVVEVVKKLMPGVILTGTWAMAFQRSSYP